MIIVESALFMVAAGMLVFFLKYRQNRRNKKAL